MRRLLIVASLAVVALPNFDVRTANAQASDAFCRYYPMDQSCRRLYFDAYGRPFYTDYFNRVIPPQMLGNVPWDPYGDGSGRTGGYGGGYNYQRGQCASYDNRCLH